MKKKQYFGNERGALAGLFMAFAAIALIPLCFLIFNYFWGSESVESKRQNDQMYGGSGFRSGTTEFASTTLDTLIPAAGGHCVTDFSIKDGTNTDAANMPIIDDFPDNCLPDVGEARTEVRRVVGNGPSSVGDARVIRPSSQVGSQEYYVLRKELTSDPTIVTEGMPDEEPACFTANTFVAVDIEDGAFVSVKIKDLKIGDLILGINDNIESAALLASPKLYPGEEQLLLRDFSKQIRKVRVNNVLIHKEKPNQVVKLSVAGGFLLTNKIHPFFLLNKGWMNVKYIENSDKVISADGNSYSVLASQGLSRSEVLYNLEVDGHTYFVLPEGSKAPKAAPIWVHNAAMKDGMMGAH